MQTKRVREILNSPDEIEVVYKNTPVWIESVNNDMDTAYVKAIGGHQSMEVGTKDLIETGRIK